jgi:hypothetical protein
LATTHAGLEATDIEIAGLRARLKESDHWVAGELRLLIVVFEAPHGPLFYTF